ncbi:MAG: GrpB family protein, partial [Cytophagales bacterium]|nr:GrpB family protein [Cytophagales bacterium]
REAFKRISENEPLDGSNRHWQKHHLYVCTQGSDGLANHLTLRDYLRENPTIAQQYGDLKKQLAARFSNDSDKYVTGKTDFILNILREVGFEQETLQRISSQNR